VVGRVVGDEVGLGDLDGARGDVGAAALSGRAERVVVLELGAFDDGAAGREVRAAALAVEGGVAVGGHEVELDAAGRGVHAAAPRAGRVVAGVRVLERHGAGAQVDAAAFSVEGAVPAGVDADALEHRAGVIEPAAVLAGGVVVGGESVDLDV